MRDTERHVCKNGMDTEGEEIEKEIMEISSKIKMSFIDLKSIETKPV